MKQWRVLTGLIGLLIVPVVASGQVLAAPNSVTQQITVTAVVAPHRIIILDSLGQISEIISNTEEDITPSVYSGNDNPDNQRTLTDSIYQQYRQIVPAGTAKYGILYEHSVASVVTREGAGAVSKAFTTTANAGSNTTAFGHILTQH